MPTSRNRREFLELGALAAAGALTAGYTATARGYAANETIHVGCLGTGGRCRMLMNALNKIDGVRIAAVCDVWDDHLQQAAKLADPQAAITKQFREVLDRADIDAVLIAAPDHWHVPKQVAACEAGKDVYVEKPLTHDLREGAAAIEAQNRHQRIVQVGMQQRSMPHIQEAREIVRSGQLGAIHKVHLTWNRNTPRHTTKKLGIDPGSVDWKQFLGSAPEQPFDEYRFRNWRWFWDFGGGILTDLMVHWIDVANWLLELEHPQTAVAIGDHFMAEGLWQTPDSMQTLLRYPEKKVEAYFEGTFVNARNASMIEFMGTEATLYIDRGRYEIIPERRSKLEPKERILGQGPRGQDFYLQPDGELLHLANWIECIRSRSRPTAPAEAGVAAVTGAHLGNRAYRQQQVAVWDA
ncbi:MAG: Gfo/Idh/MocA family oxidoreductase [Planctomycetaceae bacterium]|nr:Gfo/Idh/MocA family oxidoreductase [Planctomycetaceae bacterium]